MLCSPRWLLKQEVPKIVKSINRQLREKSIKTKVRIAYIHYSLLLFILHNMSFYLQVGAFSVLKELVVVLPDCLADHIGTLIPGIEKALNVCNFHFLYVQAFLCYFLVFFILSNTFICKFSRINLLLQI